MPFGPVSFGGTVGTFCPPVAACYRRGLGVGCGDAGSGARGGGEPGPTAPCYRLRAAAGSLDRPFLPDAVLARLRHHEDGDEEHDGGHHDGIDQAYPTLPVERYIEVVTIGTSPPPQPLPMW